MSATVERRESGWLIAVVLIVLSTSMYRAISDPAGTAEASGPVEPVATHHTPDEVRTLLAFVDTVSLLGGAGGGPEVVAAGIRHIAAALEIVASASGLDMTAGVYIVGQQATGIQGDPRPWERASRARATFATLAALLETVQKDRFPALRTHVADVRLAASRLREDRRLRDQAELVIEFFQKSASALRAMSDALSSPRIPPPARKA